MWQLPEASQAAISVLQTADSTDSLCALLEQMLAVAAVPECLLPVFEHSWQALLDTAHAVYESLAAIPKDMHQLLEQAVLSKYGDLEAVWAPDGAAQQESLLDLPLHAIELLLASDKLKVFSEATVLFTAHAYCDRQTKSLDGSIGALPQPAMDTLASLIRCPHLPQFWLSAPLLSDNADKLLLRGLQPQLKRLLLLKLDHITDKVQPATAADIEEYIPAAPASWLLPVRDIQPISSAKLEWEVEVAAIREAATQSASQKRTVSQESPTSCLLGGVQWGMKLKCSWDGGSTIRLAARAKNLPSGTVCRCAYSLDCVGVNAVVPCGCNAPVDFSGTTGRGLDDFFMVGRMCGGLDEAAWAAKGLPTSGSLLSQRLRLTQYRLYADSPLYWQLTGPGPPGRQFGAIPTQGNWIGGFGPRLRDHQCAPSRWFGLCTKFEMHARELYITASWCLRLAGWA